MPEIPISETPISEIPFPEHFPAEFWQGVAEFNQGQFYACHDTLEAIWMEAAEPDKTFYQGILQLAVALYHLGNQNLKGAMILLGEGCQRLRRYQPDYGEIDVTQLVTQSLTLLQYLQQAPAEQVPALAAQVMERETGGPPPSQRSPVAGTIELPLIARLPATTLDELD